MRRDYRNREITRSMCRTKVTDLQKQNPRNRNEHLRNTCQDDKDMMIKVKENERKRSGTLLSRLRKSLFNYQIYIYKRLCYTEESQNVFVISTHLYLLLINWFLLFTQNNLRTSRQTNGKVNYNSYISSIYKDFSL